MPGNSLGNVVCERRHRFLRSVRNCGTGKNALRGVVKVVGSESGTGIVVQLTKDWTYILTATTWSEPRRSLRNVSIRRTSMFPTM